MAEGLSAQDKAVQKIVATIAASRFTRTPIKLENIDRKLKDLEDQLNLHGIPAYHDSKPDKEASGQYDPEDKVIKINLANSSNYAELQNAIHHEDIHALLDKEGQIRPDVRNRAGFLNTFGDSAAINNIIQAFQKGQRGGDSGIEYPAYMGAYSPKQMPGLSQDDRNNYQAMLQQALSKHAFDQYTRIVNSYNASQQPQPQMAPQF